MRRRTKNFILGLVAGALVMAIVLSTAYYFGGYRQQSETLNNYKMLLETYQNPAMTKVVKLTNNLQQYDVLKTTDFEIVELPNKYATGDFFDAKQPIEGLSVSSDLAAGTYLYNNMVFSAKTLPKDLRVYEIGHLLTQSILRKGDTVDVRISFPSGLDYIVLSKKVLVDKKKLEDDALNELCIFHLNESEILRLSSALVDAYLHKGTYLYTTLYVSGGSQPPAEVTYPANEDVMALIEQDPNIVERAVVALEAQKRKQLSDSLINLPAITARPIPNNAVESAAQETNSVVETADNVSSKEVDDVNNGGMDGGN